MNPSETEPSDDRWETRDWVCVGAVGALMLGAVLLFVLKCALTRVDYYFAPLGLLCVCWLVWRGTRTNEAGRRRDRAVKASRLFVGLGAVMLAVSLVAGDPWFCGPAAIFLCGGLLCRFTPARRVRRLVPAWALLWLLIPPPHGVEQGLVDRLDHWGRGAGGLILEGIGVANVIQEGRFVLTGQAYALDRLHDAVPSWSLLLFVAGFVAVRNRRRIITTVLLFGSSLFWNIFSFALCLTIVGGARELWDASFESSVALFSLWLMLMLISIGLVLSTDSIVRIYSPRRSRVAVANIQKPKRRGRKRRRRPRDPPLAAANSGETA